MKGSDYITYFNGLVLGETTSKDGRKEQLTLEPQQVKSLSDWQNALRKMCGNKANAVAKTPGTWSKLPEAESVEYKIFEGVASQFLRCFARSDPTAFEIQCRNPLFDQGDFQEHLRELKKIPKDLKKPYGVIIADSNYGITRQPTNENDVPGQRAYEFDSIDQRWGERDFGSVIDIAQDFDNGRQTRIIFFLSDRQFLDASKALKNKGWAFKQVTWFKATGRPILGNRWGQESESIWFCWKAESGAETERHVQKQPQDPELYMTAFLQKPLTRQQMFRYQNEPLNPFQKPTALFDRFYKWAGSPHGLLVLDVTCGSGTALVNNYILAFHSQLICQMATITNIRTTLLPDCCRANGVKPRVRSSTAKDEHCPCREE